MWKLFIGLTPDDTYQVILSTAKLIDDFFSSYMAKWVQGL